MPVVIEAPEIPTHEGGVKFFANVTEDCVLPAKDKFVAEHSSAFNNTYVADTFDLSHEEAGVLEDDFCDIQSLHPPALRIHRPRGVRDPIDVATDDSQATSATESDFDPIGVQPSGNEDYYFYAGIVIAVILVVFAVWWVRSSKTDSIEASASRRKVLTESAGTGRLECGNIDCHPCPQTSTKITKIPKRKKQQPEVDLNGIYTAISDTRWTHNTKEDIEINLVDKEWCFLSNKEVLALASSETHDVRPAKQLHSLPRKFKWVDAKRKPRTFEPLYAPA